MSRELPILCAGPVVRAPRINPLTGRPGPAPHEGRDGDKKLARSRVYWDVVRGRIPHANTLPCSDCGHIWSAGERKHEYDHFLGYAAEHHHDVQPVCSACHQLRSGNVRRTHCKRGHELTDDNVRLKANAWGRECLICSRAHTAASNQRKREQLAIKRSA